MGQDPVRTERQAHETVACLPKREGGAALAAMHGAPDPSMDGNMREKQERKEPSFGSHPKREHERLRCSARQLHSNSCALSCDQGKQPA